MIVCVYLKKLDGDVNGTKRSIVYDEFKIAYKNTILIGT